MPMFHLGVEVLGVEFSFGDLGINSNAPRDYDPDRYQLSMPLGYTELGDHEVLRLLRQLQIEWPQLLHVHRKKTHAHIIYKAFGSYIYIYSYMKQTDSRKVLTLGIAFVIASVIAFVIAGGISFVIATLDQIDFTIGSTLTSETFLICARICKGAH